jgi:hypothetical protein
MNDRKPGIGPMMRAVAEYVSAVPGGSKRGATIAVGAYYNHYYGFDGPVDRAIRAGLIIADIAPNRYRLFANDRARRLWYARRELLASRDPRRIAELRAEIESLHVEQAQTWV